MMFRLTRQRGTLPVILAPVESRVMTWDFNAGPALTSIADWLPRCASCEFVEYLV